MNLTTLNKTKFSIKKLVILNCSQCKNKVIGLKFEDYYPQYNKNRKIFRPLREFKIKIYGAKKSNLFFILQI